MRAPISVIIPTLNVTPKLRDTLLSLMEGLDAGLVRELILSDGGSSDGVEKMADFVGAELVIGEAGRGGQLKRGAEAAEGDWLMFLHADTWLPEGWAEETVQHLAKAYDKAMVYSLSFHDAEGLGPRVTAGWANLRTKWFGLPYGDQALLISRELYDEIGGFSELPLMEDVEIAGRLKGRIKLSPLRVRTDPSRYQTSGWWRQGARNLFRLLRYRLGADPIRLARRYRH
ncbi:Glycosyl transferase family 2 [Celeribacter neptunius]|uniref:Glycosyl transferase family 2 n=1 Tax=Celeribacter neptunius TaxID=588602 RepID=A0A1I3PHP8_9RHOB|nr:TIGR04283 family arsenosugar biosynthesis glycosyltransferase [Celeribacter neptunius]SFJ20931.1 Glycosyl transferase family 2 [Celeribacter neptunius]